MKIIIIDSFKKDFEKEFKQYHLKTDDLIEIIRNTKFITQTHPFYKIKIKVKQIHLRWIVFKKDNQIIPIFIVMKKDKKYWENLVLNEYTLKIINHLFKKYSFDLNNKKFEEF